MVTPWTAGCRLPPAICAGQATRSSAAFKPDVLRNEADGIAEITTLGYAFFPALGQSTVLRRD